MGAQKATQYAPMLIPSMSPSTAPVSKSIIMCPTAQYINMLREKNVAHARLRALLRKYLRAFPSDEDAWIKLGDRYHYLKDYQGSLPKL